MKKNEVIILLKKIIIMETIPKVSISWPFSSFYLS